ncbi:MAG: hypothetical protein ACUBOA_07090 [Candidatus Loosdrechtia sp.]|uniref:hypothetical protein n=1 Tax=Candidatus Loosdrechtia sp. TaxID=3101272 RepID=UPI003A793695|nr:MAG: hypothetical protein QY305_01265 [Candidatus Jettenia sp. AMX2]
MDFNTPKENPVHYPPQRNFSIWTYRPVVKILLILMLLPLVLAWGQYLTDCPRMQIREIPSIDLQGLMTWEVAKK